MIEKDTAGIRTNTLLWNIFASGLQPSSNLDLIRKHFLLNLIGILGAIFLGSFSIIAVLQGEFPLALADFALLLCVIALVVRLRITKNPQVIALFGTLITGLFYLFLVFYGGLEKPTYLWSLTFPLITLYLLGRKLGSCISFSLLATCCFFFWLSSRLDIFQQYESRLIIRFISVYLLIHFFAFVAEIIHDMTQERLEESKATLLGAFNEIKWNSSQLTETNKKLLLEIDERIEVERALKQSESFLADIIESIQDGISVLNPDLTVRHTNSVMRQWYGQNLPLVGRKCYECYHDNKKPCTPCPTVRCMKSGRTEREIVPGLPGSPVELLELFSFPIKDKETGAITGAVEFVRDISAQKRLERQLAHSQKMQAVGTLAGGIAHDFNNLLMGILGRASLMSVNLLPTDPNAEHLQAIEKHVKSATDLTRQLLGTARGGKYNPLATDLNDLVSSSSSMFGRTRKEITIKTILFSQPVVADVDRQQLEQVLLNMYVNSWQAMPGGGDLILETSLEVINDTIYEHCKIPAGRYAKIAITDTGIGIDKTVRHQIFDPFFTTKDKERGTGLGLASAYGIIKNHDGFINVYSEPGHGTTFTIYLPISEKQAFQEAQAIPMVLEGIETVLLVDDEDLILEVGREMLSKIGYQVITAKGGSPAIDIISSGNHQIDLVILDLIMPGMDGNSTFERIREIVPNIPVILSSGYSMNDQANRIMNRGCNGFIQKPFNLSILSQKIRSILDRN